MKHVPISSSYLKGAVSVEENNGELRPWRLPHQQENLFPSPGGGLLQTASKPSGVRLRIETDTRFLTLLARSVANDRKFDLCIGTEIYESAVLPAEESELTFSELPAGAKQVTLWLPPDAEIWLTGLKVDDKAAVSPPSSESRKWVTYGSSITHCIRCHSPARTWPAIVAREAGFDLTCLGFGGQCHLDPMIAREIRDMPADFISLKVGINIYGNGSLNPRTFKPAIIGFVEAIREKHPGTPLALISPIISPPKENEVNNVGFTLQGMREEVADAAQRLQDTNNDRALYYFDGRVLFGEDSATDYLPDNVHPDADGNEYLAGNFLQNILPEVM